MILRKLKNKIKQIEIDYLIIGPEKPLVDGLVDFLEKHEIKTFGPNKISAQLEGSKIFTKKFCQKYQIPTANFGIFNEIKEALKFLENSNYPIVIKADGLAAGKVFIFVKIIIKQMKLFLKYLMESLVRQRKY